MRDCVSYMQSSPAERLLTGLARDTADYRHRRDRYRQRHPDAFDPQPMRRPKAEERVSDVLTRAPKLRGGIQ